MVKLSIFKFDEGDCKWIDLILPPKKVDEFQKFRSVNPSVYCEIQ